MKRASGNASAAASAGCPIRSERKVLFVDERGQARGAVDRERHQALARLHDVAGLDAAVENGAGRRRDDARLRELGGRGIAGGARLHQLVLEQPALGARGAVGGRRRLRGRELALRDGGRAPRLVDARFADEALLEQLLLARGVALGDAMVRLGLREELCRVRRPDLAPLLDAGLRRSFRRARLRERRREFGLLEFDQQRARGHVVAFVGGHRLHAAGDRGADVRLGGCEHAPAHDHRLRDAGGLHLRDVHHRAAQREVRGQRQPDTAGGDDREDAAMDAEGWHGGECVVAVANGREGRSESRQHCVLVDPPQCLPAALCTVACVDGADRQHWRRSRAPAAAGPFTRARASRARS